MSSLISYENPNHLKHLIVKGMEELKNSNLIWSLHISVTTDYPRKLLQEKWPSVFDWDYEIWNKHFKYSVKN